MKNWLTELLEKENIVDVDLGEITRNVLIIILIALPALGLSQLNEIIGEGRTDTGIMLIVAEVLVAIFLVLTFRKIYWPARILVPAILIIMLTYILMSKNGLHNGSVAGYPIIIFLTGLLRSKKQLPFWTASVMVGIGIVGYWDMAGLTREEIAKTTGIGTIALSMVYSILAAGISYVMLRRFEKIIEEIRQSEIAQVRANEELRNFQSNLETMVSERTVQLEERSKELEGINLSIERRASNLLAVANISQTLSAIKNVDTLIGRAVALINSQFGLYHSGIWLIDETNTFALLSASTAESGKKLIAEGFKLKMDSNSIISRVAASGDLYHAVDTETDPYYMFTEQLPYTRSELTLPLKKGERTIGVLDVQGDRPNQFTPDEINLLKTLANQLSTAIDNARLFEQATNTSTEMQALMGQMVRQDWSQRIQENRVKGFTYKGLSAKPISESETLAPGNESSRYSLPIKIRGQVVGYLDISNPIERSWTQDENEVVEAISERVALAIENARLLEDSQKRAAKERTIGSIAGRISAMTNIDNIIQTAVMELGQAIPDADVSIRFNQDINKQA